MAKNIMMIFFHTIKWEMYHQKCCLMKWIHETNNQNNILKYNNSNQYIYIHYQYQISKIWTESFFMFLKNSLLLNKPAFIWSKIQQNSNIVKYFYYLK